jgi:hypothetical protein
MAEYTFKIDFTSKGKKFTATSVIEHNEWFGPADLDEMLIAAIKDVLSRHPTANDIHWKLL